MFKKHLKVFLEMILMHFMGNPDLKIPNVLMCFILTSLWDHDPLVSTVSYVLNAICVI